jgi:hypothetical protein
LKKFQKEMRKEYAKRFNQQTGGDKIYPR